MKVGDRIRATGIEGTIDRIDKTEYGTYLWLVDTIWRGGFKNGCLAPTPFPVQLTRRCRKVEKRQR